MPEYLKRTGRDVTDDILVRVPEAEKHISRLKGPAFKRLGIDRGSIPNVAAPLEGQMMIQYADEAVGSTPVAPDVGTTFLGEEPYYFSNGLWRTFFTGLTLTHAEGRYQIASPGSVTVASGSGVVVDWAYVSGDAVLDLTNPAGPKPTVSGWHTIDLTYSTTDPSGWTFGAQLRCRLEFDGLQLKHAYDGAVAPQVDLPSAGNQEAARGVISLSGYMRAGTADAFSLQLENYDSISHDLTLDTIEVSLVYGL